jgi:hypothetical protein
LHYISVEQCGVRHWRCSISFKAYNRAGRQWLTPVILATWEVEIRKIEVSSQPGKWFSKLYLKNIQHEKGLVKWLKC